MDGQRVLSGRYALITHLARGGMADVWVGHDRLLDRRVAVKILHPEYAANEAFVARFRREAQAAANLNHPNVVDIYDWGRDEGIYFIVMELIQGQNLREVLHSEGALEPRRVAEIAMSVAAALGAAHERGLVHRDIKPANVLLTPEGDAKVTDFGIARAWDDSDQLTRTGAVIGTATYFSPEQAQGLTADGRSDLYALGVVMYELLTGVPPFVGESPVSVAYQHVREFAPPPSDLNPNIPNALDTIVMRCLEKDPRRRYQTAGALSVDLGRFLAGQAPVALPPP
ncbi:MAG TPA: protein kinase, partial [Acidimicrobiia bacterium]|nr:protein kinase [Acidimicrobiia bacterium]